MANHRKKGARTKSGRLSRAAKNKAKFARAARGGEAGIARLGAGCGDGGGAVTATAWQRICGDAVALGRDPRLATVLGRMAFLGVISDVEAASGFRIAEIYGENDRAMGRRRTSASPSYECGRGRDEAPVLFCDAGPDQRGRCTCAACTEAAGHRRAREAHDKVRATVEEACRDQFTGFRAGLSAVEQLCVENIVPGLPMAVVRPLLAAVAAKLGLAGSGAAARLGGRRDGARAAPAAVRGAGQGRAALERQCFVAAVAATLVPAIDADGEATLVPAMDADAAAAAFDEYRRNLAYQGALRDRARFRGEKEGTKQ